jgi:hypothetical protein
MRRPERDQRWREVLVGIVLLTTLAVPVPVMAQRSLVTNNGHAAVRLETRGGAFAILELPQDRAEGLDVKDSAPFHPTATDPFANSYPLNYAHVALGQGTEYIDGYRVKNGWKTTFVVVNNYEKSIQVRFDWWDQNGKGFGLKAQTLGFKVLDDAGAAVIGLPAKSVGQMILSLPSEAPQAGSVRARVLVDPGHLQDVQVYEIFSSVENGQETSQANVFGSTPSQSLSMYLYRVDGEYPTEPGVAVANPNDQAAVITVSRFNDFGVFKDSFTLNLPPNGQTAKMITDLIRFAPGEFEGKLQLTANVPIVAVGIQVAGTKNTLSSIPVSSR